MLYKIIYLWYVQFFITELILYTKFHFCCFEMAYLLPKIIIAQYYIQYINYPYIFKKYSNFIDKLLYSKSL
jgi:hypothetical protein